MTDRDHFAAAALAGLLAQGDDGSFSEESYARSAYRWADAMLSVRDSRTADTKNLDAAPAARADADSARAACWSGLVRRMAAMIAAALAVNEHAGSAAAPPSAASAGSVAGPSPFAWAVCNPVGVHYRSFGYHHEALECCLQKIRETGECFYLRAMYAGPPQDKIVHLPGLDPNGAPGWNAAIGAVRDALADAGVDWDTE